MTGFNKDLNESSTCTAQRTILRFGVGLRRSMVACATLLVCLAGVAEAQVRLENTIRKVETFVGDDGQVNRRLVEASSVIPGDELQYVVRFVNEGDESVDAGTIVITDSIPAHTEYLEGSAFGSGTEVDFSLDGKNFAEAMELKVVTGGLEVPATAAQYNAIRWRFGPALEPGAGGYVSFNVRLK